MEWCQSQHCLWWVFSIMYLDNLNYVDFIIGLGFASEAELGKFIEKFHEVKEATKNAMAKASTNGSSAVTPVTSANASPVTSRSSITQNDSFVSDIADPPLSATGSIVSSNWRESNQTDFNEFVIYFQEVGESPTHICCQQQQHDSERSQDSFKHLIDRRHNWFRAATQIWERAVKISFSSKVRPSKLINKRRERWC